MSAKNSMDGKSENEHEFLKNHFPPGWGHAVASSLKGKEGMVEYYETYHFPKQQDKNSQTPIMVAVIKVGNQLDGPIGVVHGGIVALLFDDVMGFAAHSVLPWVVTRDLSVEYKLPQPHEQYVVIRVYQDDEKATAFNNNNSQAKRNGTAPLKKRVFLRATCSSLGSSSIDSAPFQNDDGILYSKATITLVQIPRPPSARDDPGGIKSRL